MEIPIVLLGLLVGAIPTLSMTLCAILFSHVTVSDFVEASFQNFAGGLILAAVGAELFPLMVDGVSKQNSWIGISAGFVVGLFLIHGLENLIDWKTGNVEDKRNHRSHNKKYDDPMDKSHHSLHHSGGDEESPRSSPYSNAAATTPLRFTMQQIFSQLPQQEAGPPEGTGEGRENDTFSTDNPLPLQLLARRRKMNSMVDDDDGADWEEEMVQYAAKALSRPDHRRHLCEHLNEVEETIHVMESKCRRLQQLQHSLGSENEALAEEIDEATHSLQYKVDHCRRLLQGSESGGGADGGGSGSTGQLWLTEERNRHMVSGLSVLKATVAHIQEHIMESNISEEATKEIYEHMADMDNIIDGFHDIVEMAGRKWYRKFKPMPDPNIGSKVPSSLVIPVTLDCFTDGFLIGVTCALSNTAGLVLGFANCLEMGFLGMAYAVRIKKCTGSSVLTRALSLYCPILLMLCSAGLGALLGEFAKQFEYLYVSFVAFGTVSLIALVCEELLIESHKTIEDGGARWYSSLPLYAGVYLVLMLEGVIPS